MNKGLMMIEARREADDYLMARERSRARWAALVAETGSEEAARSVLCERAIKRAARSQASRIGLAYWPALLNRNEAGILPCDPQAFLAAERILSASYGLWDGSNHGGWDSQGHHGLSAPAVARAWFLAGCQDNAKFRLLIEAGARSRPAWLAIGIARKGDSLAFLRHLLRGNRWLENQGNAPRCSRKAIAALGRLSPELRRAALRGIQADAPLLRIRDLNWAEVARTQTMRLDRTARNDAVRAIALPARSAWQVVYGQPDPGPKPRHPVDDAQVPLICPAYPTVRLVVAQRIAMGESPAGICGGLLSRQEAHEWFIAGGPESLGAEDIRTGAIARIVTGLPLDGHQPRNIDVARWLVHVHRRGTWSAMLKVHRHPDGRAIRYMDVLDEVTPEDLDRGIQTGIDRAFENAARRLADAGSNDHRTICANPFSKLPKAMAVLTSPAALAAEGKMLSHCVGGYAHSVARGECLILSMASRHGRSTVELRYGREWTVAQHRSHRNGNPPRRHAQLLRAWLARINSSNRRKAA